VGYGFARFEFRLKKLWFAAVILIIIVPPQTISTSLYLHFRYFDLFGLIPLFNHGETINLRGSSLPYYLMSMTCMGLKNGLYIFMLRQFFSGVPQSLEEAAYVDGCGTFHTFVKIMLPDALPTIASCFLFSFVWQWTDSFYSKMFLGGKRLLSTYLASLVDTLAAFLIRLRGGGGGGVSVGYSNMLLSTGTLMMITPLLILYLFAQRAFVESISSTGIKM
jgi:multiple sugar transport system permease protein